MAELIELTTLKVNKDLSIVERKKEFIKQIKNPNHFLVNGIEVEVAFSSNSLSLEECLKNYLRDSKG